MTDVTDAPGQPSSITPGREGRRPGTDPTTRGLLTSGRHHQFLSPETIYGLILVLALIAASDDDTRDLAILLEGIGAAVVVWFAHIVAYTTARHGVQTGGTVKLPRDPPRAPRQNPHPCRRRVPQLVTGTTDPGDTATSLFETARSAGMGLILASQSVAGLSRDEISRRRALSSGAALIFGRSKDPEDVVQYAGTIMQMAASGAATGEELRSGRAQHAFLVEFEESSNKAC